MKVLLDFSHRESVLHSPELIFYYGEDATMSNDNFADLVQSIIIDQKGNIVPVAYGFNPDLYVGPIKELDFGIDSISEFIRIKGNVVVQVISDVYHRIIRSNDDIITF